MDETASLLARTPTVLDALLRGLPEVWTQRNEGPDTWSPYDVVGHLIHGEETDWIPRAEIILGKEDRPFEKYDRLAQFEKSKGRPLGDLLTEFAHLRSVNVETLVRWQLTDEQLALTGTHPALGTVTLKQLLATWPVHDLNHIRQIARYMSRLYEDEVGPWKEYLSILQ